VSAPSAETLDNLRRLIGFDSTSRNSNLDLIDWADGKLRQAGARTRASYDAERRKANLFASFGEGEGGLVLSGHTDVVPVDGQDWASNPFAAEIRDGRLYGRGACDMKGFVAVAMARAPAMAARSGRPVHVALSYDEELGCQGIPVLLDDLAQSGLRPAACVVGEPTSMQVVGAHKGGRIWRCRVCGRAAHSSLAPQAVNAVEYAARVVAAVQAIAERFRDEGPYAPGFDVPHSTISCNLINGGTGSNIVPADCEFTFEHRFLPGSDPEAPLRELQALVDATLLPAMQAIDPATGITFDCLGRIPALDTPADAAILHAALAVSGAAAPGRVAYGTEASFFQEAGIPTIVCGPGSIAQAHRADEFVPIEELGACEDFLDRLAERPTG
jgi:acetylornithine deacetylase